MAKVGIITDTHYGVRNDREVFYDYMKASNEYFFATMQDYGVKHIVHAGDMFDRRKYVNYKTLNRARADFLNTLNSNFTSYMVAGNHDVFYRNSNHINSLSLLLAGYDNINLVIDSPVDVQINGSKVCLIPWINSSNQAESLAHIEQTNASIAIGHLEINGANMGMGRTCEHGLPETIFAKFDTVLSGHFHMRSTLGNVTYVGAAYQFTWADYGWDRGFVILDTETNELEYFNNPYCIFERFDYNGELLEDYSRFSNKFVKIRVVSKPNSIDFDRFLELVYKVDPVHVSIEETITFGAEEIEGEEVEDTLTLLQNYIDNLENTSFDKDQLKRVMENLYKQALLME